jgi:hypothetical protein
MHEHPYEVTATHPDGSTFAQRFTEGNAAMECRRQLLAQGWMTVTVEPVHGDPVAQSK